MQKFLVPNKNCHPLAQNWCFAKTGRKG